MNFVVGHRQRFVLEELAVRGRTGAQLGVPFDTLDRLCGRGLIASRGSSGWREREWTLTEAGRSVYAEVTRGMAVN